MLVLSRKVGEAVVIEGLIKIRILQVTPSGQIKVGIEAPRDVVIEREELVAERTKAAVAE